jgi:DNA-binding response OmpR family regulator
MTLLIVEDNLKLAANLQRLLELEGHAVAVAHDGEEGLRRALAERRCRS